MEKSYDPFVIEESWYRIWEARGYFRPRLEGASGDTYCIMIPPPNVTGTLHMGHAFQDTIMDILIRYHRMLGQPTLWQPGTDHAGIATQMVVERQLAQEGLSRHALGREAFVDRIWRWKQESGNQITRQLRRLGASCDWSRERFTMDPQMSDAVTEVFIRLHEQGLIYRGKRLVNWDPVLETAVSDLEVVAEEESGHLWHFRYPLAAAEGRPGPDYLVVATTRPETMLGDAAVAVHPEDARYRHLIGRQVWLPLAQRLIPIIADEYVDPAFGTGCVKITPAHDFNDYQVWLRHKDELQSQPHGGLINIFTRDARIIGGTDHKNTLQTGAFAVHMYDHDRGHAHAPATSATELIPIAYQGLDRFKARARIVEDMQAQGWLDKVQEHKLMVPRGDRTGAVIEPYLTDQWFVDLTREQQDDGRPGGLAAITRPALEAVRSGQIRFVPENWEKTYFQWLENIQDWCISRQIWWGHRIPAWYDEAGNVYVASSEIKAYQQLWQKYEHEDPWLATTISLVCVLSYLWGTEKPSEVAASFGIPVLRQDEDVLDTWFSSALWPFSTLGWPQDTPELQIFYPTSVLVTGFDIIFFWVARMIMMGLKFTGQVPFHEVYIHGLVRDAEGQKMSKSKGNVLDPLDLINGVDLPTLIAKRTQGLMQPQMAKAIEQATRREYPQGIPAFGADALRFTFAALATGGRDINFDLGRIGGYRNFCNKLWNAARYVLLSTQGQDTGLGQHDARLSVADRWIISRLQQTERAVHTAIAEYRFDLAAQAIYEFTWDEYCDWYLELSKPVLQGEDVDVADKRGTRRTLVRVLESLLRLTHPFMPFLTEEIWQRVAPLAGARGETVSLQAYPQPDPAKEDAEAEAQIRWLKDFVLGVRRIRGEINLPPTQALPLVLQDADAADRALLETFRPMIMRLARVQSIELLAPGETAPQAAAALLGNLKILVPLAGLIDIELELQRLDKEISRLAQDHERVQTKLANPQFVSQAPAAIVAKERARAQTLEAGLAELNYQRQRLGALL